MAMDLQQRQTQHGDRWHHTRYETEPIQNGRVVLASNSPTNGGITLRLLLRRLSGILRPELRLAQPDLTIARRKKGQKELARANDLIRSAEGKLLAASKILRDLGFKSDF
jgi:hypothetical protein